LISILEISIVLGVGRDTSMAATSSKRKVEDFLPLGSVDFFVLMVLSEGESHGYRLVKEIANRSDGHFQLLPGNFYAILRRLMASGLIAESTRRPAREVDDRRRRYYRITVLGRKVASAEAERLKAILQAAAALKLVKA
jgi:DNA-binding PadR family transcriptional regulator